jgi:predicted Holliday junction resolvase-like endonuclease
MKASVNFYNVLVNVLSVLVLIIIVASGYIQYIKNKMRINAKRIPAPVKVSANKARF